jgi:hypothetical protein
MSKRGVCGSKTTRRVAAQKMDSMHGAMIARCACHHGLWPFEALRIANNASALPSIRRLR